MAAVGKTSMQIADELQISPRTVDEYIADACRRLGVRNRTQAAAKAVALGLLSEEL
jgi:DNA-binding CsgD family transcriptional regulator